MDVEEPQRRHRRDGNHAGSATSNVLPRYHPVNVLYRVGVISLCLYAFYELGVFHQILRGPKVNHQWFKFGLAASIAMSGIKAYLEMYEGKIKKNKIEYQNYRTATHAVMILFMFASYAYTKALWGAFGFKTIPIMIMAGYGLLLQFLLLAPTSVQNAVTFIGLTFFLQQYQ